LGGNLGVDAIQEFSVLTTNASAEYGKTAGGVINAITKSGTNQFHGDAYEFIRNDAFDAANFFDNFSNLPKPSFRRNQFGASAGGPIQKDKTFIFGDYEGVRQSEGFPVLNTVPSAAAHAGNLKSGTVTVDPSAAKYLPLFGLPNGPVNGDLGQSSFVSNQVIREDYWTARLDHTFSSKDSMFGTYMFDVTPYQQPDGYDKVLVNTETNRQFVVLEETHIFSPVFVNSVRGGYNRDGVSNNIGVSAINPLAADKSLGAVPGQTQAEVDIGPVTPLPPGVHGGSAYLYHWNSFQGYDDAFYTHGTHSVKFGFAVERDQLNMIEFTDPAGIFVFSTLANFLTNHPARFEAGPPDKNTPRGFRQTLFGLYVQDDWRARPNLTANLGLRWEMVTVPTEVQNKLSNLEPISTGTPHLGSPLYNNPTYKNFEPRVGFAWDPFHNGKTAVRGGFGVYDVLPLTYQFILPENQAEPFASSVEVNNLPAGTFFTGALPLTTALSGRGAYYPTDAKRNYVFQYNFNIQRQLTPGLTAMIGYVGARGVHQVSRVDDADIVIPVATPAGYLFPNPVGSGTKINTNFGSMRALFWAANSYYDSLEAQLTKTLSHGVQIQGSFTWGKSIDWSDGGMAGNQFSNGISSPPIYDIRSLQGLSDFNVGRTLVINGLWNVPTPKSWSGVSQYLLGGWQLGGIFTANDGVPSTFTWGSDGDPQGLNSGDPWDFPQLVNSPGCKSQINPGNPNNYIKENCFTLPTAPSLAYWNANCDHTSPIFGPTGTTVPFPDCFNLRGNVGRNTLIGPGIADFDFSLSKTIPIKRVSENFNIQVRADFFNALNRAQFAPPAEQTNTELFLSTGEPLPGVSGLLTSTTEDNREIQFALKIVW
ncbi:MAG: TonB-dependent receptor domain-containing protein, partial [Terriglobia bacterium]